ncbi:hypothetical protein M3I53_10515 [Paraburkholderia sp. CNPSo 3272]|uniref:hypothetical protein n=1 Tax=Paraburkholderia sp. CNPSo 3272 TaxID=2940931 RepID=UPI0020B6569B|nr:hypothetical protein [Paraburkholderia sp. CNPSo 3272]MCP3723559.1 hypothetical protein [Paraburkholderia sp. CNPSo 3272]
MLEPLIEKGDATRDTAAWQQALARIHGMILLNSASNRGGRFAGRASIERL